MQNSFLDLLGSALIPVLSTDIAAGTSCNVHLALVAIAAIRAFPNELTVSIGYSAGANSGSGLCENDLLCDCLTVDSEGECTSYLSVCEERVAFLTACLFNESCGIEYVGMSGVCVVELNRILDLQDLAREDAEYRELYEEYRVLNEELIDLLSDLPTEQQSTILDFLGVTAAMHLRMLALAAQTLRELADDLYHGCPMGSGSNLFDDDWDRKYIHAGL